MSKTHHDICKECCRRFRLAAITKAYWYCLGDNNSKESMWSVYNNILYQKEDGFEFFEHCEYLVEHMMVEQ